jgi:uncharacterized OB-fold protein
MCAKETRVENPPVLPEVDALTDPFWRSGRDGVLRFQRCHDCQWWIHPPKPRCPKCMSATTEFEPVSGEGVVWSFTINHQRWSPDLKVPYAIAIVELPEQAGMRLTTRLVEIDLDEVRIGLPVRVVFHEAADLFLPYFMPLR